VRGANATLRKEQRYDFDENYEVLRLYNMAALDEALSLVPYPGLAVPASLRRYEAGRAFLDGRRSDAENGVRIAAASFGPESGNSAA
jgi:hypothetical protein